MAKAELPEVVFDDARAVRLFPRPEPKMAVRIFIPRSESGEELPTAIKPKAGGLQVFYGDFYGLVDEVGDVRRGSAKDQWEVMHVKVDPLHWVKVLTPQGYVAAEPCKIVTRILGQNGDIIPEHFDVVNPGDWIVKQPGGELQYIRAAKYPKFYFTQEEAEERGLGGMGSEEFAAWAVEQARRLIR